MEKEFFFIILQLIIFSYGYAQGVGIGTVTPNASAILDIMGNSKGVLLPRTSTTSRNPIANPARGLLHTVGHIFKLLIKFFKNEISPFSKL